MAKTKKRADGRYQAQVYIGRDPEGKRKYKSFYAATQKGADRLAAEFKSAIGRGLDPMAGPTTVKDLLDNLIAAKTAAGVGESWKKNLLQYKNHLRPLWALRADAARTADIQAVLNALAEQGLSHKTIGQIAGTLSAAFRLAIPETVQHNPCEKVVVPAGRPPQKRDWLDAERQAWVRDTPHRAQRAAMLMMYSGLRRGEATALTWADIDLSSGTISVNKSWDFVSKRMKDTKTSAGNRVVYIPQILVDFLKQEREHDPNTLHVLHSAAGKRLSDMAWRRMWDSYMLDLNIKYGFHGEVKKHAARQKDENGKERGALPIIIKTFSPHELRHTFCTLMYLSGVDVLTARDQMGHSSVQVTQEIYTHMDKKYKAKKMSVLDEYINENA